MRCLLSLKLGECASKVLTHKKLRKATLPIAMIIGAIVETAIVVAAPANVGMCEQVILTDHKHSRTKQLTWRVVITLG